MRPCIVLLTMRSSGLQTGITNALVFTIPNQNNSKIGSDYRPLINSRLPPSHLSDREYMRPLIVFVEVKKQTIGSKCVCFICRKQKR